MNRHAAIFYGGLVLLAGGTAALADQLAAPAAPPQIPAAAANFMSLAGYLPRDASPDPLLMIPPAPTKGSAGEARDLASSARALALRGGPRWALATRDADLFTPSTTGSFACAAGRAIGPVATPRLDKLMGRIARDLAAATRAAKIRYQRARPFMVNHQPMCTPEMDAVLRKDGSYPSGHSAIGYGWGLVLGELVPTRTAQLFARGRAFGDSRRICNVHWLSDVEEGGMIAAAVVARLHAEPAFRADMDAVRAELASAPAVAPATDCAAEAAALALQ